MHKTYLGDAVYVEVDDQGLVLTTENGISVTNRIVLEPDVVVQLERYIARLRDEARYRSAEETI